MGLHYVGLRAVGPYGVGLRGSALPPCRRGAMRGSVGLRGAQWGSEGRSGAQRGAVGLSGAQKGSVGLRGAQWGSEGLRGAQWGSEGHSGAQRGSVGLRGAQCRPPPLRCTGMVAPPAVPPFTPTAVAAISALRCGSPRRLRAVGAAFGPGGVGDERRAVPGGAADVAEGSAERNGARTERRTAADGCRNSTARTSGRRCGTAAHRSSTRTARHIPAAPPHGPHPIHPIPSHTPHPIPS